MIRFQIAIYLATLAGIIIHFIIRWRDSNTKKEVFQWKDNLLFSLYVFCITMAMVTFRIEIANVLTKTGLDIAQYINNYLVWFFIGYFGDSVWKNIESRSVTVFKRVVEKSPVNPPSNSNINQP